DAAVVNARGALIVRADAVVPNQITVADDLQAILDFRYHFPTFDTSDPLRSLESAYTYGSQSVIQTLGILSRIVPYVTHITTLNAQNAVATPYVPAGSKAGVKDRDDPGRFALSGTVNLLSGDNGARAWIGKRASVNADPSSHSAGQSVSVNANATVQTINIEGIPSIL